jgi:hypothetical protein
MSTPNLLLLFTDEQRSDTVGDEGFAQHGFNEWISIEDAMYRKHFSENRLT